MRSIRKRMIKKRWSWRRRGWSRRRWSWGRWSSGRASSSAMLIWLRLLCLRLARHGHCLPPIHPLFNPNVCAASLWILNFQFCFAIMTNQPQCMVDYNSSPSIGHICRHFHHTRVSRDTHGQSHRVPPLLCKIRAFLRCNNHFVLCTARDKSCQYHRPVIPHSLHPHCTH